MATELIEPLVREIRVYGIEAPVIATIRPDGVELRIKGKSRGVFITWVDVVRSASTPGNSPSYLMGRPMELMCKLAKDYVPRKKKGEGKEEEEK
jgi:hypothetical protein